MALEPSEVSLDLSLASRMFGSGVRFANRDGGFSHRPVHQHKRPSEPSQQLLLSSALQDLDLSLSLNGLKRQRVSAHQRSAHLGSAHLGACSVSGGGGGGFQRRRLSTFDDLPDDLVSVILGHAAAASDSPADVINIMMTSRRICHLAGQEPVLRRLPPQALRVAAGSWSPSAEHFLSRCSQAGNSFASYALGMITFYCLGCSHLGLRLLTRAAIARSPEALYALAIVHFNGSGGSREQRDVTAGVVLCMRAASLRHVEATRELGHCLQDGYGARRDPAGGRQLLMRANVMDAETAADFTRAEPCSAKAHACSSASAATSQLALSEETAGTSSRSHALQTPEGAVSQCNGAHRGPCRVTETSFPQGPQGTMGLGTRLARSNSAPANMYEDSQGDASLVLTSGNRGSSVEAAHGQRGEHSEGVTRDEHSFVEGPERQGSAPSQGLEGAQGHGPSNGTHQCFCLPTVTLPIEARVDGWVHAFLIDWNLMQHIGLIEKVQVSAASGPEGNLQKCNSSMCGRVELRSNEFRCCSACTQARYCSRACQAHDWKLGHKKSCEHTVSMQRTQELA